MESRRVIYFIKIAHTLSFRKAARELFVSPQALSKQIQLLEEEVGAPLFERTNSKLNLTEAGKVFLELFEPVMIQYENAKIELQKYVNLKKYNVKIGFFQGLPQEEAVYSVIRFLAGTEPKLKIELLSCGLDNAKDLLEDGTIDMVITNVYSKETWGDVEMITLDTIPASIIVSLYHPWIVKSEITIEDIQKETLLCLRSEDRMPAESFYRNVQPKEKRYVKDFDSLLTTLALGNAFAVFPAIFSQAHSGKFHHFALPEEYRFNYQTVAVFKENHPMSAVFQELKEIDKIYMASVN